MTPLCKMVCGARWVGLFLLAAVGDGHVVGAPDVTANGLGTVSTATGNVANITGGTLAGNNLFHSFSTFNLANGETANFNVTSNIANILARVTGGPSTIDGTITSTINGGATLSNANLFFLNPAGVMFTSNAQVKLGGNFVVTTASYIALNNGADLFYGDTSHTTQDNNLTVTTMPVSSFGFLPGSAYKAIAISSGATFSAAGFQFVGGNFTTGANVSLSLSTLDTSAVIGIFSGASGDPTLDATVPYLSSPTADYSGAAHFKTYGNVTLGNSTGGSVISAPGTGSSVVIRGGQLVQQGAGSMISASQKVSIRGDSLKLKQGGNISSTTGSIGIDTTGDVTLTGGTITSAGGAITLGQLSMVNLTLDSASSITETHGMGGNLTLNSTGTIAINHGGTISTASSGQALQLSANSLALNGTISTQTAPITIDTIADVTMTGGTITSAGGPITMGQTSMGSLSLDGTSSITETGTTGTLSINTAGTIGNSGTISTQGSNLTIDTTGDLNLTGGTISSKGGTIRLGSSHLGNLSLDASSTIDAAAGGDVFVTASGNIVLTGGTIESTSADNTHAGLVNVTSTSGNITLSSNAQIASIAASSGNAGSVTVTDDSGTIALSSGAQIASITNGSSDAGSVIVNANIGQTTATDALTIDGGSSGIFSLSNGSGNAVDLTVTATGEIVLSHGGQIASMVSSTGSGNAGNVTVNANYGQTNDLQALTITGTGLSSINSGIFSLNNGMGSTTGFSSNVNVTAVGDVTLALGGQIASVVNNSAGGTAGSVTINLNTVIGSTLTIGGPTTETTPATPVSPFPIIYSLTQNPAKADGDVSVNALLSYVTLQSGAVIQTSSQDATAGNVTVQASSLTLDGDTAIQSLMSQSSSDTATTGRTGNVTVLVLNPFSFNGLTLSFSGPLSIDSSALIQTIAKPTLKTFDPLGTVKVNAGSLTEGGTAATQDTLGNYVQVNPSNLEIRRFNTTTYGLPNANDPSTDDTSASTKLTIQTFGGIPDFILSLLLGNLFGNYQPPPPAPENGLVLDGSLGGTAGEHIQPMLIDNTYYQYDIVPGDGTLVNGNLFLSFSEFDLGLSHPDPVNHPNLTTPVSETALFDMTGHSIQNILVRVTDGLASTINGTLAEAGTRANIFFLNSAGAMFGGNSSLNVSGAFTVSTANNIVFSTDRTFSSSKLNSTDALLIANPNFSLGTVADFGFAANTVPQGVTFIGARLSDAVQNGSPSSQIQVIAGQINLEGTTLLNATQTLLFSAASGGTLSFSNGNSLASFPSSSQTNPGAFTSTSQVFNDSSFTALGDVNITGPAVISVPTPNYASTIAVRAANFTLQDSEIVDQTTADSGSKGGTVLIDVTGTATITSLNNSSFISTSTLGDSEGGSVQVNAQELDISSNAQNIYTTGIFSTAEPTRYFSSDTGYTTYTGYGAPGTASGNAGSITLDVSGSINVSTVGQISTNTNGLGNAGTITIEGQTNGPAPQVVLSNGGSITSSTSLDNSVFVRSGAAGRVIINASSLTVMGHLQGNPSLIATSAGTAATPSGPTGAGGTIMLNVTGQTGAGNGDITISNSGQISASSYNNGQGGTVSITQSNAADGLTINGAGSSMSTGVFAAEFSTGNSLGTLSDPAIKIVTDAPMLLEAGGEITTSAADTGNAGPISINGGNLSIDGTGANAAQATGILSDSTGAAATPLTATGNGGDIGVTVAGDILITKNGVISASSETVGKAGTVTINQNGSTHITAPNGSASNGGLDITLGGSISTAADGPGTTPPANPPSGAAPGQITLNLQALTLDNGSITSSTSGASNGGGITVNGVASPQLAQFVVVQNGGTISSNTASTGSGGTITINSGSVNVAGLNSAISTSATAGTGSGGNINLVVTGKTNTTGATGDVTVTDNGSISASSSTTGQAGTVSITQSNSLDLTDPSQNPATNGGLFLGSGGLITTAANGTGTLTPHADAGNLTLNVEALTMTGGSQVLSSTKGLSKAGEVAIDGSFPHQNTQFIVLQDGAKIASETGGANGHGQGGTVTIGTESLLVDGAEISTSSTGGVGKAGDIAITAAANNPGPMALVTVQNGGNIISSSNTVGSAGIITIQADQMNVTGNGTTISTNAGQLGSATNTTIGEITLSAQDLTVTNSGLISATTGGLSSGGTIMIKASNQVTLSANGKIDASSTASTGGGDGGSVLIGSNPVNGPADYGSNSPVTVSLFEGGVISAGSQHTNGGNIAIHANDISLINGSLISTSEPNGAANTLGGDITIQAGHSLYLNNFSFINSNAGQGTGGNIVIDPEFTILNHSGISAAGGAANGNVTIDSTYVLSGTSFIIATGTVSIDTVPLDLAGSLIALPANLTSEERRLREKCARAINHEFSSLIVVGRGGTESAPEELQPDFGIGNLPQSSSNQTP